jgi:hypothetical protein
LEEYPVTAALVVRQTRSTVVLDSYFESPAFHAAIQERRSLGLSFGETLPTLLRNVTPALTAIIAIEHAIAKTRRFVPPAESESETQTGLSTGLPTTNLLTLALAPAIDVISLPKDALGLYGDLFSLLRKHPDGVVAGLLEADTWSYSVPNLNVAERVWVMVDASNAATGPSLSESPDELAELLDGCRQGTALEDIAKTLQRLGVEPGKEGSVIDDLLSDGLLIVMPP